jgi:hypothetical protein
MDGRRDGKMHTHINFHGGMEGIKVTLIPSPRGYTSDGGSTTEYNLSPPNVPHPEANKYRYQYRYVCSKS